MNNMGMFAIPSSFYVPLLKFMGTNVKYLLGKTFFVNTSWAQRSVYNAVKWMIDQDTINRYTLWAEAAPQDLVDLMHPSQLEKRFGGEAETPKVLWPPMMGPDYLPNGDDSHLNKIPVDEYEQLLTQNPLLNRHPDNIKEGTQASRDFIANREENGPTDVKSLASLKSYEGTDKGFFTPASEVDGLSNASGFNALDFDPDVKAALLVEEVDHRLVAKGYDIKFDDCDLEEGQLDLSATCKYPIPFLEINIDKSKIEDDTIIQDNIEQAACCTCSLF